MRPSCAPSKSPTARPAARKRGEPGQDKIRRIHLVDRPDDLDDAAKLLKVCLEVLLGEGLARGKLANVHLALARLSFLAGHLGQEVKIIASKIIFPRKVQHLSDRRQYHFRSPSCP